MKKFAVACACLFIILMLASCDNTQDNTNAAATANIGEDLPASSNVSNEEKSDEYLLQRIEDMENEITSLKKALVEKEQIPKNNGAVFNALDNMVWDNIYLGMDWDGEYLTAIYVKKPVFNSCEFYILLGYEVGGVQILNSLIKPVYYPIEKFEGYEIDKDKFQIIKLKTSKLKYDKTSSMLIIMIDSNGNEYSQYQPSYEFTSDI